MIQKNSKQITEEIVIDLITEIESELKEISDSLNKEE